MRRASDEVLNAVAVTEMPPTWAVSRQNTATSPSDPRRRSQRERPPLLLARNCPAVETLHPSVVPEVGSMTAVVPTTSPAEMKLPRKALLIATPSVLAAGRYRPLVGTVEPVAATDVAASEPVRVVSPAAEIVTRPVLFVPKTSGPFWRL